MKIKISSIVLLLPLFIISGCDSDQKSPASKKDEVVQTAPVVTEAPTPIVDQASAIITTEDEVVEAEVEPVQQGW